MKKFRLTILFLFSTFFSLFAQDLKEIIEYYPSTKLIHEKYTVLKSDKKTKQGSYISFFRGKHQNDSLVFEKGQFENGKKTGTWVIYKAPKINGKSRTYGQESTKGEYKNDVKSGIWGIYIEDGQIKEQYDFDKKIVIKYELVPLVHIMAEMMEGEVIIEYQLNQDCTLIQLLVKKSLSAANDKQCIENLKEEFRLIKKYNISFNDCDGTVHTKTFTYKY